MLSVSPDDASDAHDQLDVEDIDVGDNSDDSSQHVTSCHSHTSGDLGNTLDSDSDDDGKFVKK